MVGDLDPPIVDLPELRRLSPDRLYLGTPGQTGPSMSVVRIDDRELLVRLRENFGRYQKRHAGQGQRRTSINHAGNSLKNNDEF